MQTSFIGLCLILFHYAPEVDPLRRQNLFDEISKEDQRQMENNRSGRLFSLFNIVKFENKECVSQESPTRPFGQPNSKNPTNRGNRVGTCFSAVDCHNCGGTPSGSCAFGFGVCCVIKSTSGMVNGNCSYIQNPGFPDNYESGETRTYDLKKMDPCVCSLRLDFDSFDIRGPANTIETNADCIDQFRVEVTGDGNVNYPVICGTNNGQHIYLDMGQEATEMATLTFNFGAGGTGNRMWDIKVTQVKCGVNNPPPGCLQYYTGKMGTIQTFNFEANTAHLNNQDYNACIRQNEGFCCIEYSVCPDVTDPFTIANMFDEGIEETSLVDSSCTQDYVIIDVKHYYGCMHPNNGSRTYCGSTLCSINQSNQASRTCGSRFNVLNGVVRNNGVPETPDMVVCDCTPPFFVGIKTDDRQDDSRLATRSNRGVCLCYNQVPCGQS